LKATYQIDLTNAKVPKGDISPFTMNNVVLRFISDENYITSAELEVTGLPIRRSSSGAVESAIPEAEEAAFMTCSFLSNYIRVATAIEAIPHPAEILLGSPSVAPENEAERLEFEKNFKTSIGNARLIGRARIVRSFKSTELPKYVKHTKALGYLANALRAQDPFTAFEWAFKVVEYFFPGKDGERLDQAASMHLSRFDSTFTKAIMSGLRLIRIGSVHPHANKTPPLNLDNLEHWRKVQKQIEIISRAARVLIDNPPS
jgi:hypothetical protein